MKTFDRVISFLSWMYLAATLLSFALLHILSDDWWFSTLILYGPRWVMLLPAIPLTLAVAWRTPRNLVAMVLGIMITLGPFMNFRLSLPSNPREKIVRVLTGNINHNHFNANRLSIVIKNLSVDIVAIQECAGKIELNLPESWHEYQPGGLAIFSKFPLKKLEPIFGPHLPDPWPRHCAIPCIIDTPYGEIIFSSIEIPSAQSDLMNLMTSIINFKINELISSDKEKINRENISKIISKKISNTTKPIILAGDFSMPTESTIYSNVWKKFDNAFTESGVGYGWTFQTKIMNIFLPIRVDHILVNNGALVQTCEVGPDIGSDHLPVIADIALP